MKRIVFFLLLLVPGSLFSIDLTGRKYFSGLKVLEFTDDSLIKLYEVWEGGEIGRFHFEKKYQLIDKFGIPYLRFSDGTPDWMLIVSEKEVFLRGAQPVFAGIGAYQGDHSLYAADEYLKYETTSFLTETLKNGDVISYKAENLNRASIPWVEGVPGYGIGEKVTVTFDDRFDEGYPFRSVWIGNGYLSYERPDLYQMNGRVKRFRIKSLDTGKEKIIELNDTPVFQPFTLHPRDFGHIVEFEILEVYPGTLYEDICINTISTTIYGEPEFDHGIHTGGFSSNQK